MVSDRISDYKDMLGAYNKKILQHGRVDPVSYTHLDVYKRQVFVYACSKKK